MSSQKERSFRHHKPSKSFLHTVSIECKRLCNSVASFAEIEIDTRYNGNVMTSIGYEGKLKALEQAYGHLVSSMKLNQELEVYPDYVVRLANDVMECLYSLRDSDHFRTYTHTGSSTSLSTRSVSSVVSNTKKTQKSFLKPRSRASRRSRKSTGKLDISSKYSKSFTEKDTKKLLSLRMVNDNTRKNSRGGGGKKSDSTKTQKQQPRFTKRDQYPDNVNLIAKTFTRDGLIRMENKIRDAMMSAKQSSFSSGSPGDIACVPQGFENLSNRLNNEKHTNHDDISVNYDGEEL